MFVRNIISKRQQLYVDEISNSISGNVFNQFNMYNSDIYNSSKEMSEIKILGWLIYDITMLGMGGYAFANAFMTNVDAFEKILIFLASLTFFAYRIYILHLDAEKKRMDNNDRKEEIKNKKGQQIKPLP